MSVQPVQPPGDWAGADPRYRGYRPAGTRVSNRGRAAILDHRVRQALALVPPVKPDGRLLDLGGGDGFVTAEAAGRAGAGLGVTLDVGAPDPLVERTRPVVGVTGRLPGPLPFRGGSFDVVVSLETIEHLLEPDLFLQEIRRVLVDDGALVLSTPRLDSLLVVASLLLGVQPPGIECSPLRRYGNPFGEQRPSGHVHLFTKRAMREALAANGFRLDAYREGRFSSSWWQAVRTDRRPRPRDLLVKAILSAYDLIPFRKDVMVLRAVPGGS